MRLLADIDKQRDMGSDPLLQLSMKPKIFTRQYQAKSTIKKHSEFDKKMRN